MSAGPKIQVTMTRPLVCLIAVIFPALVLSGGCTGEKPLAVGDRVHDFRLETLDHGRFYLNRHQGRVKVLVFWATWCTHCKQELGELSGLAQSYPKDRLTLAGICTDPENASGVRETVTGLGLTFPILLDPGGNLAGKWGIRALPTTLVMDSGGKVISIHKGFNPQIFQHLKSRIQMHMDRVS